MFRYHPAIVAQAFAIVMSIINDMEYFANYEDFATVLRSRIKELEVAAARPPAEEKPSDLSQE
jgi:hypothetical protein